MHVVVVPASPKTGQATVRALLADSSNPSVKAYYRDLAKVPAEFTSNPRFEAVKGDVEEVSTLDFAGSDTVINITPPIFDEQDIVAHAKLVSENVKAAVQKAGVKKVVYLSSVGAQYDHGTGEILTNHTAEVVLADAAPEVIFVRCAYFMENWAMCIETIQQASFMYTTLTPLDLPLPMIAVADIGTTLSSLSLTTSQPQVDQNQKNPRIITLAHPTPHTSHTVHAAFEAAHGKPIELRPIPKEGLLHFYSAVFPPAVAKEYAAMNESFLKGGFV